VITLQQVVCVVNYISHLLLIGAGTKIGYGD
jgi:hypothetical protein